MRQFLVFLVLFSAHAFVAKCEDAENIQRPCGSDAPISEDCVRNSLAESAGCSIVSNPDNNKTIVRPSNTFFLPFANISMMNGENTMSNISAIIQNFFINLNTQQAVIAVIFKNVFFSSPQATFYVSKPGEEPTMSTRAVNATYSDYLLTAVISLIDGNITCQSLEGGTVYTHFYNEDWTLGVEPPIGVYDDVDLQTSFNTIEVNKLTALSEIFLTESYSHFLAYIQNFICNCGLSLAT